MAENSPSRIKRAIQALFGVDDTSLSKADQFDVEATSQSVLLGAGKRSARPRADIYANYMYMSGDPIVSAILRLHVTAALGAHETRGDVVFIEKRADLKAPNLIKIVDEVTKDLSCMINKIAPTVAFNACAYGDAYARPYTQKGLGVVDCYVDEMVHPPLVQPFERGSRTVGFFINTGTKVKEELNVMQLLRMKMPRQLYTAQYRVIEKAAKMAMTEDDVDKLPVVASMVGGSFLEGAEEPYQNLSTILTGMVSQRLIDAIDESIYQIDFEGMTEEQKTSFAKSITAVFDKSRAYGLEISRSKTPVTGKIRHTLPTWGNKQRLSEAMPMGSNAGGRPGTYQMEDAMFHARLLAGALGMDLSLVGFADQMAGGLGEGGWFRMSAQAAEKSRVIRTALTEIINDLIRLHVYVKHGLSFEPGDLPWTINFFGSISALAREKQSTRLDAANTTMLMVQILAQLKDLGATPEQAMHILRDEMGLDETSAQMLAAIVANATEPTPPE